MAALRRSALTKGLLGGSRGWMAIGAAVWGPRLMKKALGRNEVVVAREVLKPGQALYLEALEPPTRAQRRAARRRT
ncbi:MAG TPA: hypothetical protein VGC84_00720 [Ilumatobacteraceae bacterium]|jgi:hypothetical protein